MKLTDRHTQTLVGVRTVESEWDMTHARMRRPEIMIEDSLDLMGGASSVDAHDIRRKSGTSHARKQAITVPDSHGITNASGRYNFRNRTLTTKLLVTAPARLCSSVIDGQSRAHNTRHTRAAVPP